jgi:hypothetical protein
LKLPHLTPVAKAQLWGLLVGTALAVLACEHWGLGYRIMLIVGALAWVLSERFLAPRLTGSGWRTIAAGVASGTAFPWIGVAAAVLLNALRP